MLFKMSSIILLTFLMITVIYGQILDENLKQTKAGLELDIPICLLLDHDDANPTENFKNFAKYEACEFQKFMDSLYELDCYIMHRIDKQYNCISEECLNTLFGTRERIYTQRLPIACVCDTPRNITAPETEDTYDSYATRIEERPKKISTLCEYIICWKKLWTIMREAVEDELKNEKIKNPPISACINPKKDGERAECEDGAFGC